MANSSLKGSRHAIYDTHIHLVFVVKHRRKVFTGELLLACEDAMERVATSFGVDIEEFNGEEDHVHLLVTLPPTVSIASLVNSLKGVSSRILRRDFGPHLEKALRGEPLWSRSYYAGSAGGAPLESLRRYIQEQERPKESCADSSPA